MPRISVGLCLAFLVTVLFMLALRPVAESAGLIDKPGGRKQHRGLVPVIGGLAMFFGMIIGSLAIAPVFSKFGYYISATSLLVLIGALDDRYDLPAAVRLLAQSCAALMMIVGGDVVAQDLGEALFQGSASLGGGAGLFTFLIVLTAINAFNMFDGSDGVAGIQALIALVFLTFLSVMAGQAGELGFILCLAGAILGFLAFNWPSKRTNSLRAFMGDAGSTMLGFSLAWLCLTESQGPSRVMAPVVALWIFALPIYDFFSSMIRRTLSGRSPLHGDSDHLHHVLRRFGLRSRSIALTILIGSTVLAGIGVAGYLANVADGVMFTGWLLLGGAYYLVFASGIFIRRRVEDREADTASTGTHATLWRQR